MFSNSKEYAYGVCIPYKSSKIFALLVRESFWSNLTRLTYRVRHSSFLVREPIYYYYYCYYDCYYCYRYNWYTAVCCCWYVYKMHSRSYRAITHFLLTHKSPAKFVIEPTKYNPIEAFSASPISFFRFTYSYTRSYYTCSFTMCTMYAYRQGRRLNGEYVPSCMRIFMQTKPRI